MKTKGMLYVVALSLALLAPQGSVYAAEYASLAKEQGVVNAKKLEKKLWSEVKKQNWQAVSQFFSPAFQGAYIDGINENKSEALSMFKKIDLGQYQLSDFHVTKTGDTQIVTYRAKSEETINNKRILSTTPRVSVWQMTPNGWQVISHTNLSHK